ncbi:hypothetical protein GCM10011351_18010 [Paraliobacillus quinghaiensis]|uniref:Glycosyltransferase 2-like domain-containing protein n=1 Tax=Paraliobacillus quinghaiensis TaxID=470815 RepID=A0A917TPR6_9BACI|nr:glycosyltransferase [Paraliobacillus quinghaiensis]GGM32327.1 hypothetical protein GCM10011351_18010 [Paraliobacillus quinghaiensis]
MDHKYVYSRLEFTQKRISELEKLISSELEKLETSEGVSVELTKSEIESYEISEHLNLDTYKGIRSELADEQFGNRIKETVENLPKSNGSSYFEKLDVNIGMVMDEFLYHSYESTANFHYVTPQNYKEVEEKVDIFLLASAWKGLNNEWKGLGNPKNQKIRDEMFEIINYFKSKGKETVFYSKEDPTNYEFFIEFANNCDYIFTTAVEKIPHYKKDCNTDQVYLLEFGVNPVFNNPVGLHKIEIDEKVIFAGSWYKKYPKRQKDTTRIFDGVINAGNELKIIDRNYNRESESFLFPTKYLEFVSPEIDHETLQLLTKLFTFSINLNSIQDSNTMFASRVYELQSMGNLILSNYSLGINNLFPNVFMIFNSNEVKYILNNYFEKELYQQQMYGVRKVLRLHTTFHRLTKLLSSIGYVTSNLLNKKVAVIYEVLTDNIKKNFDRQTYLNKNLVSVKEFKEQYDEYSYFTFFAENYEYGEFYLEDMINGFKYTDSTYITKNSYYDGNKKIAGIENDFIDKIDDYRKTIYCTKDFNNYTIQELKSLRDFEKDYSIDSLELNVTKEHNYITSEEPKFTVIIPTYNNGDHLYNKCFMSLRRSSMFEKMEIIIVDDGSTDDYTPKIVNRLERLYSNVKAHFYKDGGSGSASRPRNKGVLLASTEYITFLDPDNEAINDGYTKLYRSAVSNNVEVVIGNIIKVDQNEKVVDYYQAIKEKFPQRTVFQNSDSYELLIETSFKAQSIQAMMIRRSLLINNNITMLVGVVGEDTLFFYDVLLNTESFIIIKENIHVYYAGVEGSSVNNITINTFMKYQELEKEKFHFLNKNNLLKAYMALRFNYYFKNWYLKKLELVKDDDRKDAEEILYQIYKIYENSTLSDLDETIVSFVTKFR